MEMFSIKHILKHTFISGMVLVVSCVLSSTSLFAAGHVSDTPVAGTPFFNNVVAAVAEYNSVLYIGGSFTHAGMDSGSAALFDMTSPDPNVDFPYVEGTVYAAVSDGSGGWFIGGDFSSVGGQVRNNLARVDTTTNPPTVDANWNPGYDILNPNFAGTNGAVYALILSGSTLYLGGDFTQATGVTRNRIAAVDATGTGGLTTWNPSSDNTVRAMLLNGTTLYVGGSFTNIGGAGRASIAALDSTLDTSNATSWDPGANGAVYALAMDGTTLYVGGGFSQFGGQSRQYLASIDVSGNTPTTLSLTPDNQINALAIGGGTLYMGGTFQQVGTETRSALAAVDVATESLSAWDPALVFEDPRLLITSKLPVVETLALNGSTLYAGGLISRVGAGALTGGMVSAQGMVVRNGIVALDTTADTTTSNATTSWDASVDGHAYVIAVDSATNEVFAGGDFIGAGAVRSCLCAMDADPDSPTFGDILAWNPGANGEITSMELVGSTLYVTGWYSGIGAQNLVSMGGEVRNGLGSFDLTTGQITSDFATLDTVGSGQGMAVSNGYLYWAGFFSIINGQTREGLAAFDLSTGALTAWDPNPYYPSNWLPGLAMLDVDVLNDTVYACGAFIRVGGSSGNPTMKVNNLAAFEAANAGTGTGAAIPFGAGIERHAYSVVATPDAIFLGGLFVEAGGGIHHKVVALNPSSGKATAWDARGAGGGQGFYSARSQFVSLIGNYLYAGGLYYLGSLTWNGQARGAIVAFDALTGDVSDWNPDPTNQGVQNNTFTQTAEAGNGLLFIGGRFDAVAGERRHGFAAFYLAPSITTNETYLPTATAGQAYTPLTLQVEGVTPFTWSQISGSLPTGMTLDANGVIQGTPQANSGYAAYTFEAQVLDGSSAPNTATHTYTIFVDGPPQALPFATSFEAGEDIPAGLSAGLQSRIQINSDGANTGSNGLLLDAAPNYGGWSIDRSTVDYPHLWPGDPALEGALVLTVDGTGVTAIDLSFDWKASIPASLPTDWYANLVVDLDDGSGYRVEPSTLTDYSSTAANAAGIFRATAAGENFQNVSFRIADLTPTSELKIRFRWLCKYSYADANFPTAVMIDNLSVTDATGSVAPAPPANIAPDDPVTLYVDDNDAQTGSEGFPVYNVGTAPVFSAIYVDENAADSANQYRLQVSSDSSFATVDWDSGPVSLATMAAGTRCPDIAYAGTTLASDTVYYWRVKFWDTGGLEGSYNSALSSFQVDDVIALAITTATLPDAAEYQIYDFDMAAVGGTPPYIWSAQGLPSWLDIDANTGKISGTAPAGSVTTLPFSIRITLTDFNLPAVTFDADYEMIVGARPPLVITSTVMPNATEDQAYSETLAAYGGIPTYSWAAVNLPTWLALNGTTGVLSGTPPIGATSPVTISVTVTDSNTSATESFTGDVTLTIDAAPGPVITSQTLTDAVVGVSYTAQFSATGGTPGYSWSATGLPTGLTMNASTGAVTGTPTTAGTYPMTVTVADSNATPLNSSTDFDLTVLPGALAITTAALFDAREGEQYTMLLQASGGTGTYTWSATGLPSWLNINAATGTLTGTPLVGDAGTASLTVTASDGTESDTAILSLTILVRDNPLLSGSGGCAVSVAGRSDGSWLAILLAVLAAAIAPCIRRFRKPQLCGCKDQSYHCDHRGRQGPTAGNPHYHL